MCISYLGQKVTTWVRRDHPDHLGQTQVITSYYLGQSYYLVRNIHMSFIILTVQGKPDFYAAGQVKCSVRCVHE